MNLAFVLVFAALVGLGIIARLAVSRSLLTKASPALAAKIRPIDVEAFRNLIDPAEDEYLRHRLPPGQFRSVRRARLRAIAAYVQVASSNASILVRVGESALASGNPQLAESAHRLVNDALLLRRNATIALARIHLALAWPNSGRAAVRLVDRYERLSSSAMLLGRLQNPAVAVRLSPP
jgi:hypothetical protein